MGLSAHFTLSGPLAELRLELFPVSAVDTPAGYAEALSVPGALSPTAVGLAMGMVLILAAIASRNLLSNPKSLIWGATVGLAVVSGWAGTSHVAYESFGSVAATTHTFAEPIGDSLIYLMMASGMPMSFAVGSVAGVIGGAAIGSLLKGQFRWEACDDPGELRRQILGAALIGMGAAVAGGCTIGQGVSALSVLAYGAPITLAGIVIGAALGLRQLISGFAPAQS